jgi:hypothetical protein
MLRKMDEKGSFKKVPIKNLNLKDRIGCEKKYSAIYKLQLKVKI